MPQNQTSCFLKKQIGAGFWGASIEADGQYSSRSLLFALDYKTTVSCVPTSFTIAPVWVINSCK